MPILNLRKQGYHSHEEEIAKRVPFNEVYFTESQDSDGQKMSKSLGNSPDPLELIAKYGADGLRHGIMSIAPGPGYPVL